MMINCAVSEIMLQPMEPDTDTSKLNDAACDRSSRGIQFAREFYLRDVPDEMQTPWKLPAVVTY